MSDNATLRLPTEDDVERIEQLYQDAFDALEGMTFNVTHDRQAGKPYVELEHLGAFAVLIDRIDVQLEQSTRTLADLRQRMLDAIALRAEQQARIARGEAA